MVSCVNSEHIEMRYFWEKNTYKKCLPGWVQQLVLREPFVVGLFLVTCSILCPGGCCFNYWKIDWWGKWNNEEYLSNFAKKLYGGRISIDNIYAILNFFGWNYRFRLELDAKIPCIDENNDSYRNFRKEVLLWESITFLPEEKRAVAYCWNCQQNQSEWH